MRNLIKELLKPKLKLLGGTRFVSFLFIATSIIIAAGILWAANIYYNIDTGEVVVQEIQRVTQTLRATYGLIVGGSDTQNPTSGYKFEVVGSTLFSGNAVIGNVSDSAQELRFLEDGSSPSQYVGLKAPSGLTTNRTYILPQHDTNPPSADYVLTWQSGNQLQWKSITGGGIGGDIFTVGDCESGDCFTASGTASNSLWFEGTTADDYEILLTAADPTQDYTITLPAATGTVALGTGTQNYVAYWSGTNTLTGEEYLSTSRGGTGANSSSWNGMVKVVGGTWSATQGTAGYAAYWSDANTVAAEQYLALSRGGTGAGLSAVAGGIVYSGASALAISSAGTTDQLLASGGSGAPTWKNIADLITATNGLTASGTTSLTLKLGGTLSENTTITQGDYNLIFNLTGTGDFKVQDNGTDILTVSDDGKIYFKSYPLAESGKQVLREMIPIMGFDLPVQCSTACDTENAQVSRTIEDYPFSSPSAGSTRKHKLVIRYATSDTSTNINFRVYDETTSSYVDQGGGNYDIQVSPSPSTSLDKGVVAIANVVLPSTSTDDWYLTVRGDSGLTIKLYQIFLAAYDEIQ